MKHTPEPWEANGAGIYTSDGRLIAECCIEEVDIIIDVKTAARIVACVNACAGIDSEYLKKAKLAEQIANANAANYYKDLLLRFFSAYKNARNARPDGNSAEQFNLRQRIAEIEAAIMEGLL